MAAKLVLINFLALAFAVLIDEVGAKGKDFRLLSRRLKYSMLSRPGDQRRRYENDQKEANVILECHLESVVETDDFDSNAAEIERLIEDGGRYCYCKYPPRGPWGSSAKHNHKALMMRTLQILSDLTYVRKHGYRCDFTTTYTLARTNSVTMDTIGRRIRRDTDLWPRIDGMVFEVALGRAARCIRECKDNLADLTIRPPDETVLLQDYWRRIIEHRLGRTNLERAYLDRPGELYMLIHNMSSATVAQAELDIARQVFKDKAQATADEFDAFLTASCQNYLPRVLDIFVTFDFDIRLRGFIPGVAVPSNLTDFVTNNVHRLYMIMCRKLVNERSPSFLPLLEVGVRSPMT